jgi:DNA-binding NarL/FixJ family response regulator
VRVLVIDDHPLIQEAVSNVLRRIGEHIAIELANECAQGFSIASEGAELDLVVLDLNLPGLSGIAAVKTWRTRFPAVPVIVLSAAGDQQTVLAAMGAGAAGFIPKSSTNEVMLAAVRLVMDGGKYLPPEVLSRPVVSAPSSRARLTVPSLETLGLTQRQMEVLRMIGEGAANKTICRRLGLAERTVKTHITAVFRALNVSSRTQAALAAADLGLARNARQPLGSREGHQAGSLADEELAP